MEANKKGGINLPQELDIKVQFDLEIKIQPDLGYINGEYKTKADTSKVFNRVITINQNVVQVSKRDTLDKRLIYSVNITLEEYENFVSKRIKLVNNKYSKEKIKFLNENKTPIEADKTLLNHYLNLLNIKLIKH